MARPPKEAYYLSDAEKRDLIQLIQQGKHLPEQCRFILFEDKREVELVWNGKTREVCTTVLPSSRRHVRYELNEARRSGLALPLAKARSARADYALPEMTPQSSASSISTCDRSGHRRYSSKSPSFD